MRHVDLRPVVVTRAEAADGPLSRELRELGLTVLLWPAVSVAAARRRRARRRRWPRSVLRLDRVCQPPRRGGGARAAAAAPAGRAHRGDRAGHRAGAAPARLAGGAHARRSQRCGAGRRLRRAWRLELPGAKILYPASSRALPTIAAGLTQLGAEVTQVEAYRTEAARARRRPSAARWIARGAVGAVTFASPSAVIELARALGADGLRAPARRCARRWRSAAPRRASCASRGRTAVIAESGDAARPGR